MSDKHLECNICSGAKMKGRSATKDAELVFCNGTCQREVPEYHTLQVLCELMIERPTIGNLINFRALWGHCLVMSGSLVHRF